MDPAMDPALRATLLSSRGSRTGINDELLMMVEHGVRGWPRVCKELSSSDLEEQTDTITATLAA